MAPWGTYQGDEVIGDCDIDEIPTDIPCLFIVENGIATDAMCH